MGREQEDSVEDLKSRIYQLETRLKTAHRNVFGATLLVLFYAGAASLLNTFDERSAVFSILFVLVIIFSFALATILANKITGTDDGYLKSPEKPRQVEPVKTPNRERAERTAELFMHGLNEASEEKTNNAERSESIAQGAARNSRDRTKDTAP